MRLARQSPAIAAFAILCITLFMMASWKDAVQPLQDGPPATYVVAGEDETLDSLSGSAGSPVEKYQTNPPIYRLVQNLDIDAAGRLTMEGDILLIQQGLQIDVNGSLIIRNSTILDWNSSAGSWDGIIVHPTGGLEINGSLIQGGDPMATIHDPAGDLSDRVEIARSELAPAGRGLVFDDTATGPWLANSHAASMAPTDVWYTNATLHEGSSSWTLQWTIDNVSVTANATLPTSLQTPGLHIVRSEAVDGSMVVQARGVSLFLIEDSNMQTQALDHIVVDPFADPIQEDWTPVVPILDELDEIEFGTTGDQASSTSTSIRLNQSAGRHNVWSNMTTNATSYAEVWEFGYDRDDPATQFLLARDVGDQRWISRWQSDRWYSHGAADSDWVPGILQGHPVTGDLKVLLFSDWSRPDQMAWYQYSTQAEGSVAMPYDGWKAITICPEGSDTVVIRHEGGRGSDAVVWNASNVSWDSIQSPWNDTVLEQFDANRSAVCTTDGITNHTIFQQAGPGDNRTVTQISIDDREPAAVDTWHWNDSAVQHALIVRHTPGPGFEVARVPYGLPPTTSLTWQAVPSPGGELTATNLPLGDDLTWVNTFAPHPAMPDTTLLHLMSIYDPSGAYEVSIEDGVPQIVSPLFNSVYKPSVAACDFNQDGDTEVIIFGQSGSWSIWDFTVIDPFAPDPKPGDWTQQATGLLPASLSSGVLAAGCLDATADHPPLLVVGLGGRTIVVLSPPASGRFTDTITDLNDWEVVPVIDDRLPAGHPFLDWMGYGEYQQGFLDPATEPDSTLTIRAPRWRAGAGNASVHVRVAGVPLEPITCTLMVGNETRDEATFLLDEDGGRNVTMDTDELEVRAHRVTVACTRARGEWNTASLQIGVVSPAMWATLSGVSTINGVTIQAVDEGLVIDGSVTVSIDDLTITGNLSSATKPLVDVSTGVLTGDGLHLQDHDDVGLEASSATITIDGVDLVNLDVGIDAAATTLNLSSIRLSTNQSTTSVGINATTGTTTLDGVSATNLTRVLELYKTAPSISELSAVDVDSLGWITGASGTEITPALWNWSITGAHANGSVGLHLAYVDRGTFDSLAWNVSTSTEALMFVEQSEFELSNSSLMSNDTLLEVKTGTWLNVTTTYLDANGSVGALIARDGGHMGLLDSPLLSGLPSVPGSTSSIHSQVWVSFGAWSLEASPPANVNVTVSSAEQDAEVVLIPVEDSAAIELDFHTDSSTPMADRSRAGLLLESWRWDPTDAHVRVPPPLDLTVTWGAATVALNFTPTVSTHVSIGIDGDTDLDGIEDHIDNTLHIEGVALSTAGYGLDLQALDGLVHVMEPGDELQFAVPKTSEDYRVWFRARSVDGSEGCANMSIIQVHSGSNETDGPTCLFVDGRQRWLPGPMTDDSAANAYRLVADLVSADMSSIAVDTIIVMPAGMLPHSPYHPDIDGDEILDGLETNGPELIDPIMPDDLRGLGAQQHADTMFGWFVSLDEFMAPTITFPTADQTSELWIHSPQVMGVSHDLAIAPNPKQPIELEDMGNGWYVVTDAFTGDRITLATAESATLHVFGNLDIDLLWTRELWSLTFAGSALTTTASVGNSSVALYNGRSSPHAFMNVSAEPAVLETDVTFSGARLTVDDIDDTLIHFLRNGSTEQCEVFRWIEEGWHMYDTFGCDQGTHLDKVAFQQGWSAVAIRAGPDHHVVVSPPEHYDGFEGPAQGISLIHPHEGHTVESLSWSNSRLLVETDQSWFIWEASATNVSLIDLQNNTSAPTSPLQLYNHARSVYNGSLDMDACLMNDHLMALVTNGSNRELVIGVVSSSDPVAVNLSGQVLNGSADVSLLNRYAVHSTSWTTSAELSCGRSVLSIREGSTVTLIDPSTGLSEAHTITGLVSADLTPSDLLLINDTVLKLADTRAADGSLASTLELHTIGAYSDAVVDPESVFVNVSGSWDRVGVVFEVGASGMPAIQRIKAPWVDHRVDLADVLYDRLLEGTGTIRTLYVDTTATASLELNGMNSSTIPVHPDTDLDGSGDGRELTWWNGPSQVTNLADATVELGCHDHAEPLDLATRWAEDPWIQLADQCRVADGAVLQWSPLEGVGGHISWGLDASSSGPHRLQLETGQPISLRSVTPVELVNGNVSDVNTAPAFAGGQANPEVIDQVTLSWLPMLLRVEITSPTGDEAEVIADDIWAEVDTFGWDRSGKWLIGMRVGGSIEVDVSSMGRYELHINFATEAQLDDLEAVHAGPGGNFTNISGVIAGPIAGFQWGPIGGLDPLAPDSDGDQVQDGVDAAPFDFDVDQDGLTDAQEAILGTDPTDRDTDGDGLFDGIEVQLSNGTASCTTSAQDWVDLRADVSAMENETAPSPVTRCSEGAVTGASTWLHRRAAHHLLDMEGLSRLDADNTSWTEPLDPDTDGDGLPDGWIDGWTYAASLADVSLSSVNQLSGAASLLEVAGLGAYDASRWLRGDIRDGLAGADEGEDISLDGSTQGSGGAGTWGMEPVFHLPTSVAETDNLDDDADGDGIPDGWEVMTSAFFVEHGFTTDLQDPTVADGLDDLDLGTGEWVDDLLTGTPPVVDTDGNLSFASQDHMRAWLLPIDLPSAFNASACSVVDWIRFPASNLRPGTTAALVSSDLPDQPEPRWSADGGDWTWDGNSPIVFTAVRPHIDGLVHVSLDRPVQCDDLDDMRLLIRMPPNPTTSWNILNGTDAPSSPSIGYRNLTAGTTPVDRRKDNATADWVSVESDWDKAVPIAVHQVGDREGDGVPAWLEFAVGTLATRVNSDSGTAVTAIDLMDDRRELAPADNDTDLLEVGDVELTWRTSIPRLRLGWRWAATATTSDAIAVAALEGWNTSAPNATWVFDFQNMSRVNESTFRASACGTPSDTLPFSRLDDGSWMALVGEAPAAPTAMCIFHPATHWDEPETWESREALGILLNLTTDQSVTDAMGEASTWTVNNSRRHQYGLPGSPFLRDADGDGLVDGLEGNSGWNVDIGLGADGDAPFHAWREAANISGEAWWNDTDGDHVPDAWDPDADNDGVRDGHEVGFAIDLDGDGLPGHMDDDSDADGRIDGLEFLPEHDTDNDGLAWNLTLATGIVTLVKVGVSTLDADSDNDGLFDGCVDELAWDVLAIPTETTATIATGVSASFDDHEELVWKPTPVDGLRRAGRAVYSTVNASNNNASVHLGAFAASTDIGTSGCDPWEGEERDGITGINFTAGDLNPIRNDTDGDGLLDGPGMYVDWAVNWTAGSDEDDPWTGHSGNDSDVPENIRNDSRGTWLAPLEESGHLLWGRAGEVMGPFTSRRWWPHLPAGSLNGTGTNFNVGSAVTCKPYYTDKTLTEYRDALTLLSGATDDRATGVCWDVIGTTNGTDLSVGLKGWSNGSQADTDSDMLDDAGEREWRVVDVLLPDWLSWKQIDSETGEWYRNNTWYYTSGDPWRNDTDQDGHLDGIEAARGWAIDNVDTDMDGLSDDDEDVNNNSIVDTHETDPRKMDSDGDGLTDGPTSMRWDDEYIAFSESKRPMWHKMPDGCTFDEDKEIYGEWRPLHCAAGPSNATLPDTDGDGLIDGAEVLAYKAWATYWEFPSGEDLPTNHTSTLTTMDSDGDGLWDGAEYPPGFDFSWSTFDWDDTDSKSEIKRQDPTNWFLNSTSHIDGDSDEPTANSTGRGDLVSDSWEPYPWIDTDGDEYVNGRDKFTATSVTSGALDGEFAILLGRQYTGNSTDWRIRNLSTQDNNTALSAVGTVWYDWSEYGWNASVNLSSAKPLWYGHACDNNVSWEDCTANSPAVLVKGTEISILKEDGELGIVLVDNVSGNNRIYIPRANGTYLELREQAISASGPDTNVTAADTIMNSLLDLRKALQMDADFDGILNSDEWLWDADPNDRDSDDDGLIDGLDARICVAALTLDWPEELYRYNTSSSAPHGVDMDGDGKLCPGDPDSDADGIRDGTEVGVQLPIYGSSAIDIEGTDTSATTNGVNHFQPDLDPSTTTIPWLIDSDFDGVPDGWADIDHDLQTIETILSGVGDEREVVVIQFTEDGLTTAGNNSSTAFGEPVSLIDALDGTSGAYQVGVRTLRGGEDLNANGRQDALELDPMDADSDDDGLPDGPSQVFRDALWDSWNTHFQAGSSTGDLFAVEEISVQMIAHCSGESWEKEVQLGQQSYSEFDDAPHADLESLLSGLDLDQDGVPNAWDSDSDGDRMKDATECGVTLAVLEGIDFSERTIDTTAVDENWTLRNTTEGTNLSKRQFVADLGPDSITSPWDWDTDDDGLSDGQEDRKQDGLNLENETDPLQWDTDSDHLSDFLERGRILSDIPGAVVWMVDQTSHRPYWSTSLASSEVTFFVDADEGETFTDPLKADTDGDGYLDGDEDLNRDGELAEWDIDNTELTAGLGWTTPQKTAAADGDECDIGIFEAERDDPDRISAGIYWASACELDPANPDSDGDGVFDGTEGTGWEVVILSPDYDESKTVSYWSNSNPFRSDTDNDGSLDGEEYNHRIDPRKADTDLDWLPDKWEIDNNGSANMMETTPPEVLINKNGFDIDIDIECAKEMFVGAFGIGVDVCTAWQVVREFDLEVRINDAAGVLSAKVWVVEGHANTANGVSAPAHAYDVVAVAMAQHAGEHADGGLAHTVDGRSYPAPVMSESTRDQWGDQIDRNKRPSTGIGIEEGLRRNITWTGTMTRTVDVGVSEVVTGDIWDLFRHHSLVVLASDVNGNEGNGSIDFPSIGEKLADVASQVWASIVNVFSAARAVLSAAADLMKAFVMFQIELLITTILEPMMNAALSATGAALPTIGLIADILEYATTLDIVGFVSDDRVQAAFGAVLSLVSDHNDMSHTILSAVMNLVMGVLVVVLLYVGFEFIVSTVAPRVNNAFSFLALANYMYVTSAIPESLRDAAKSETVTLLIVYLVSITLSIAVVASIVATNGARAVEEAKENLKHMAAGPGVGYAVSRIGATLAYFLPAMAMIHLTSQHDRSVALGVAVITAYVLFTMGFERGKNQVPFLSLFNPLVYADSTTIYGLLVTLLNSLVVVTSLPSASNGAQGVLQYLTGASDGLLGSGAQQSVALTGLLSGIKLFEGAMLSRGLTAGRIAVPSLSDFSLSNLKAGLEFLDIDEPVKQQSIVFDYMQAIMFAALADEIGVEPTGLGALSVILYSAFAAGRALGKDLRDDDPSLEAKTYRWSGNKFLIVLALQTIAGIKMFEKLVTWIDAFMIAWDEHQDSAEAD